MKVWKHWLVRVDTTEMFLLWHENQTGVTNILRSYFLDIYVSGLMAFIRGHVAMRDLRWIYIYCKAYAWVFELISYNNV